MSLRPVAKKLADLLKRPVAFVDDCIGEKAEKTANALQSGDVLLLENVRYYNEEEANDAAFAEKLAKLGDVYVNDAFGAAHRAHASTEGVARVITKRGGKAAAGLLMERELKFLGDELENPARPFVVILGGAGSLLGAFVGSFVVGFLYNFGIALFPDLAYFILFLPMVLVLVFMPQGLFGRVPS